MYHVNFRMKKKKFNLISIDIFLNSFNTDKFTQNEFDILNKNMVLFLMLQSVNPYTKIFTK